MFVSLDLETGGENCGIIQISAEIVRLELSRVQGKAAKDTLAGVSRGTAFYRDEDDAPSELFNEYVNPGEDAEWAPAAVNEVSHGLSKSDPRISSARPIDAVWSSFKSFIERNIAEDECQWRATGGGQAEGRLPFPVRCPQGVKEMYRGAC